MEPNKVQDRLTPAAAKALEDLVHDYRREIITRAEQSAIDLTGELKEISVHDIVAGAEQVRYGPQRSRRSRFDRYLRAYAIAGLSIAVAGVAWFIFQEFIGDLPPEGRLPLMVTLAGLVMAGFSALLLKLGIPFGKEDPSLPSSPEESRVDHTIEFLRGWQEIELLLREMTARKLGESRAKQPISKMVDALVKAGKITHPEANAIEFLLKTRNRVVHGELEITHEKYDQLSSHIHRIRGRLRSRA